MVFVFYSKISKSNTKVGKRKSLADLKRKMGSVSKVGGGMLSSFIFV
jgi:hypothetical protein